MEDEKDIPEVEEEIVEDEEVEDEEDSAEGEE